MNQKACMLSPQHRYLFLTKNPGRYMKLAEAGKLPERDNFWYGSSVPTPDATLWWSDHHNTFVSIEPMLEEFPTGEGTATVPSPVRGRGWEPGEGGTTQWQRKKPILHQN